MNQLKHTPGPWIFNGKEVSAKDGAYYICFADTDTYNTPEETEQEIANCKLIAAAPELLNSLMELANCDYTSGTHLYTAQQNAKSAIEKAIGQPFKLWFEK